MKWHMNETTRQIALNSVIVLCLVSLGVFIMMFVQGLIMRSHFSMVLGLVHSLEGNHLYNQVTLIGLAGTLFSFLYIFVAWTNLFPNQRKFSNKFLKAFSMINLVFIFIIIYLIVSAHYILHVVQNEMQTSFKRVMSEYASMTNTRIRMDETQQSFKCCGYNSYEDWFEVEWVKEQNQRDGHDPKDSTPYSCCDPFSNRACIFFNIKHGDHDNYQYKKDLTIFRKGCKDIISEELIPFFNAKILRPSYVLFPSILLCFVLSRYVSTSVSCAISKGNTTRSADGHLLKLAMSESENEKLHENKKSMNHKKNNADNGKNSKEKNEDTHPLIDENSENDNKKIEPPSKDPNEKTKKKQNKNLEKRLNVNVTNNVNDQKPSNSEKRGGENIYNKETPSLKNERDIKYNFVKNKTNREEIKKNSSEQKNERSKKSASFNLDSKNSSQKYKQNNKLKSEKNSKKIFDKKDKHTLKTSSLRPYTPSPSFKSLASYKMYPPLHYMPGRTHGPVQSNSADNHYV